MFKTTVEFDALSVENYGSYANIKLKEVSENVGYEKTDSAGNDGKNQGDFKTTDMGKAYKRNSEELYHKTPIVRERRDSNDRILKEQSPGNTGRDEGNGRGYNLEGNLGIRNDSIGARQAVRKVEDIEKLSIENDNIRYGFAVPENTKNFQQQNEAKRKTIQKIFNTFSIPLNRRAELKAQLEVVLKTVEKGQEISGSSREYLYNILKEKSKKTQEMINETRLHLPARLSRLKSNYILHRVSDYVNTNIMENKEKYSITKEVEVSSSEKVSDTDIMIDNAVKYGEQSASDIRRDLAAQVKKDKENGNLKDKKLGKLIRSIASKDVNLMKEPRETAHLMK